MQLPPTAGTRQFRLALGTFLVTASLAIAVVLLSKKPNSEERHTWTYIGDDFPQAWDIGALDNVYLTLENTIHYALDTPLGAAEWNTTLPSGGHLLHFTGSDEPFSISMFHQLRCLNIIRQGLVEFRFHDRQKSPERIVEQCMDYIKQMVLCRADVRLESARNPTGPRIAVSDVTHTCRDWSKVYTAAEDNYRAHVRSR